MHVSEKVFKDHLQFHRRNFIIVEPNANKSLVPIRPSEGCPEGTIDGITTCFCEDYCSWNICRLKHPPINCPMVMSWQWYSDGMHWMAQSNISEPLVLDSKLTYFVS